MDDSASPQDCLLCDWESASPGQTSDVDDNVSLEQARANFERFNWMYDPDVLPDWLPHRPSAAELQARATLRPNATRRSIGTAAVCEATS